MASANWMGSTMLVRLKNPPISLSGKIENIIPGQNVTLVNVWIEGKEWRERLVIASADIEDLNVQDDQRSQAYQQSALPVVPLPRAWQPPIPPSYQSLTSPVLPVTPTQYTPIPQSYQQQNAIPPPITQVPYPPAAQRTQQVATAHQPSKPAFVDPAIVSMGKPPVRASRNIVGHSPGAGSDVPSAKASPQAGLQPFSSVADQLLSDSSTRAQLSPIPNIVVESQARQETPNSGLVESMEGLTVRAQLPDETIDDAAVPATEEQENSPGVHKKNRRRNRQPKKNIHEAAREEVDPSPARGTHTGNKGKGWRETPMLENTSSFQPYKSLRRNKGNPAVNDNGWASEDVTDVQEMGDFDFESSLRKFDKRAIFDDMREKDKVDEADRLVSHNRARSKPGTAGGKNLHYSENVLDIPSTSKPEKGPPDDFWKSEADDGALNGSERLSGRELGSRQGSRRGESKTSARRSQSRKASVAAVGQAPSRVNSGVSFHGAAKRRRQKAIDADAQNQLPAAASSAGFYAVQSNRRVEILSPLQMLNLESIAQNDLGLTEDMMTENAGRGIAEVALHVLTDPAIRVRLAAADGETPPTVVILAGNNKSGYRSIAAARHLRNKGVDVILCVVGIEKGDRDFSVDTTKQLRLYKQFGGKVCTKSELFEHVRKASMPVISMDAPRSVLPQAPPMAVTLIIDALLGHVTPFEDLRASDQATVYELIEWSNRNEAFVLAVDVPTGIDHTTGQPTIQDGHSLYIRPRYVVSLGAPKKGLFEVVSVGDDDDDETVTGHASDDAVLDWNLFLADIGLGAAVWKRAGTKIRRGIDFGTKWALQMKYRSEADQAEE